MNVPNPLAIKNSGKKWKITLAVHAMSNIEQIELFLSKGYDFGCGIICQDRYEGMFKAWLEKEDYYIEEIGNTLEESINNLFNRFHSNN